jgi:hypothetical protein
MTPRCIVVTDGARCPRWAVSDLYTCDKHSSPIVMARVNDAYHPQTRELLALSQWETVDEGQALIDALLDSERRAAIGDAVLEGLRLREERT